MGPPLPEPFHGPVSTALCNVYRHRARLDAVRIVVSSATRNAGIRTPVSLSAAGCRITPPLAGRLGPAGRRWRTRTGLHLTANRESPACMSQSTTPYRSSVLAGFVVRSPMSRCPIMNARIVRRRRVVGVTLVIGAVMQAFR